MQLIVITYKSFGSTNAISDVTKRGASALTSIPGKLFVFPTNLRYVLRPSTKTQFLSCIISQTIPCFPLSLPTNTST